MRNSIRILSLLSSFLALFVNAEGQDLINEVNIPVSAPIDTDSAGRGGDIAIKSVFRLVCLAQNTSGTGFLHKSGNIITADHVVKGCPQVEAIISPPTRMPITIIAEDADHDLALLKPNTPITAATPLPISDGDNFKVGTQVSTWGFPAGYFGVSPMLSVGFLAGIDGTQMPSGTIVRQWVVNAAFNGGNSGGPLLQIETGAVFGVVSSKLAPISQESANILQALENQHSGFMYSATTADGRQVNFTEGQLIGRVLTELRRQVQLVIGKAVLRGDMVSFLTANKIEP